MKIKFLTALTFAWISLVFGQKVPMNVLVSDKEFYTILWDSVKTDVEGTPEDSVYYRVDIKRTNNVTVWYRTVAETNVVIKGTELPSGTFYVQVVAFDAVKNPSDPGLSNNCRVVSTFGCWQFVKLAKPRMPAGIKVEVNKMSVVSPTTLRGGIKGDCRWSVMYFI